ncbi:MAG: YqjK family protein, partial [Burkholderiales bacterium]
MTTPIELAERRGHLLERIVAQRATLAQELAPLARTLAFTGRLTDRYHSVLGWMRARPVLSGMLLVGLALLKPRQRAWRVARWGLLGWRLWKRFGDSSNG